MKIDAAGAYNIVRKSKIEEVAAKKTAEASGGRKTDVAEFSHAPSTLDKDLSALKPNLMRDISYSAPPERLGGLRQSVKAGTYRIPTEAIVASILDA